MSKFGICNLSVVPIRADLSHKTEQVSQLLYGEIVEIMVVKKEWTMVRNEFDSYEGWVSTSHITKLSDKDYKLIKSKNAFLCYDTFYTISKGSDHFNVLFGSVLRDFDGMNYYFDKEKYIFHGQAIEPNLDNFQKLFDKITLKYINAPYLWGGRTPFGIDCSGFTQMVYKFLNIALPRDAYQQVEHGKIINFVEEARKGDLAFFGDTKITHVGIILDKNKIIHASGKVRIDAMDNFGIFNVDTQKYSHHLKTIKRII